MKAGEPWIYVVGQLPHRVAAYEHANGTVYLRWRIAGDWRRKSLGFGVRDAKGKVDTAAAKRAQKLTDEHYGRLVSNQSMPAAPVAPLTIAEGWALAIDAERGLWNVETEHRKEMARAIGHAKSVWGAHTAWNAIERSDVRRLWRAELKRVRAKGKDGARSAEIIVARVLAVAAWLREEGKIAPNACTPWKAMKKEMKKDIGKYEPNRPRYTLDEFRALLTCAPAVDARWGLLLTLGAEYRLGQVVRCMRSDLDMGAGTLRIAGSGKKRGTLVQLTAAQRLAVMEAGAGYLAGLEKARETGTIPDYPLFPGGRLPMRDGVPVTRADHATRPHLDGTVLRKWLRATEAKARVHDKPIAHVEGRGWYGLRRAAVDAAKEAGISREGLQQHGGWSDTQTPDAIYADQNATYAAKEAAVIRSKIRGETDQNGPTTQNGPASAEPSAPSNSQ